MNYVKRINNKIVTSISIAEVTLNKKGKTLSIACNKGEIDNEMPTGATVISTIRNEDKRIIDPDWQERPENFDLGNTHTWGGMSYEELPFIIDPEKQYFDRLASKTSNSGPVLNDLDKAIFQILIEMGDLPTGNEWSLL